MVDKRGRLELTRRLDKHNRRAVTQSMLVELLHFEQWNWCSIGTAHQIGKSRVSCNSPGRVLLLRDILGFPWFGPQQAIGHCEWPKVNSCFDCGRPLRCVKKIKKKWLSQLLARGNNTFTSKTAPAKFKMCHQTFRCASKIINPIWNGFKPLWTHLHLTIYIVLCWSSSDPLDFHLKTICANRWIDYWKLLS